MRRLASHVGRYVRAWGRAMFTGERVSLAQVRLQAAIAQVERALAPVREQLGQAAVEQHQADKALAQARADLAVLAGRIDQVAAAGDDDAARALISRQLDLEAALPRLEADAQAASSRAARLERHAQDLLDQQAQLQAELEAHEQALAQGEGALPEPPSENEMARRISEAQARLEAELQAALHPATPLPPEHDPNAEYAALGRQQQIEQRLERAKHKA